MVSVTSRIPILLLLGWQLIGSSAPAGAETDASVRSFVERVNEAAVGISTAKSEQEARQKCRRLLAWAFDVPIIARGALGDAWDHAAAQERNAFLKAFEEWIVTAYVRHTQNNQGMTLVFVGARPQTDGRQLAATRMIVPDKPEQTSILVLRPSGHSWRVTDVMTNGRSLLLSERQEYSRILESQPGNIQAVIDFIRSRERR